MARRSNSSGGALLIVFFAAIVALSILAPLALAIWMLVAEARAWPYRGLRRPTDVISSEDKAVAHAADIEIERLEAALAARAADGDASGFQRRADGLFDARNPAARDLNGELERLALQISDARARSALIRAPLETRLEGFVRARSSLIGARAALSTFVIVYLATIVAQLNGLGLPLTASGLLFGDGVPASARVPASLAGALAAALAAWIARSQTRTSLLA